MFKCCDCCDSDCFDLVIELGFVGDYCGLLWFVLVIPI